MPGAVALSVEAGPIAIIQDRSAGLAAPGAYDDFDRPDALALGVALDGKPWVTNEATGGRHVIAAGAARADGVGGVR